MRLRATILALLVLPGAALAGKVGTAGDQSLRITANVTPNKASKAGQPRRVAVRLNVEYLSLNEGTQIQAFTKNVLVTNPRGMRARTGAFPACLLSALNAADTADPATVESACPAGSEIGTGTATADARPTLPDPVEAVVTAYNGIDDVNVDGTPRVPGTPAVILLAKTTIGVNAILPFDIDRHRLLLEFSEPTPDTPQLFHLQTVDVRFPRKTGFFTAPRNCPNAGWLFTQRIENYDGPPVEARHRVACRR